MLFAPQFVAGQTVKRPNAAGQSQPKRSRKSALFRPCDKNDASHCQLCGQSLTQAMFRLTYGHGWRCFFFLLFFRRLSARLFSIVLANRFILLFCLKISLGKCHPQCFQDGKNAVHNIWAVSGRLKEPYFLVLNNLHRL